MSCDRRRDLPLRKQTTKRDWAPRRHVYDAMPMMVRGGGDPRQAWLARRLREWACRLGALPPMRMTASWFGSAWNPPNTSVWRDVPRLMASSPRIITQKPWSRRGTIGKNGRWVCGRSAAPTGSASPVSRASSKSGEMLAFAHIPTNTTATGEIDINGTLHAAPPVAQRGPRQIT